MIDIISDSLQQQIQLTALQLTAAIEYMSPRELIDYLESETYCTNYPNTTQDLTELISRDLSVFNLESIA